MCTIVSLTGETVIKPLASIIDYLVNKPVEDSPLNDIARQIGAFIDRVLLLILHILLTLLLIS